jgi:hypothetical protein
MVGWREGSERLRLATARVGSKEKVTLVLPGGAVPLDEISDLERLPTDLLSLLEGGRFDELRSWWDELSEGNDPTAED